MNTKEEGEYKIGCGAVNFKWAKETPWKLSQFNVRTYKSLTWNDFIIGIDKRRETRLPSAGREGLKKF